MPILHAALDQTTDRSSSSCSTSSNQRLYQFFMQHFIKLQTAPDCISSSCSASSNYRLLQTVSVLHAVLHQTTDRSRLYQFFMQYFIKLQTAPDCISSSCSTSSNYRLLKFFMQHFIKPQTTPILRVTLHQTTDWDYIVLYAALHQITC